MKHASIRSSHWRCYPALVALLLFNAAAQAQTSGAGMTRIIYSQAAITRLAAVFAPGGTLRASINLGNPVLANLDPPPARRPVSRSIWRRNWPNGWACPCNW